VSFQVNGEPVVGQGKLKTTSKDGSLKCKVSKAVVNSEAEGEAVEVMAEPEARPRSRVWTGPAKELPEVGEGSEVAWALWAIAGDIRAIRRAQEAITCNTEAGSTSGRGSGQCELPGALRHGLDVIRPRGLGRGPSVPSYVGDGTCGG